MSGKAYTMKEMKAIVDYLTEHKAYGEIRGRKMWMDFANSSLTNRTWQSLKETFLKRILPDIQNPYYKLTMEQVRSFKNGNNLTEKNRLEIRSTSEDSSTNNLNEQDHKQPNSSDNNEGEKTSGEGVECSKIPSHHRFSAETVIIDNCYDTPEDIQRELESPKSTKDNDEVQHEDSVSPTKSLRDFITYSEPLTPMLQEVLDDFATDEENEILDTNSKTTEDITEAVNKETDNKNSASNSSNSKGDVTYEVVENITQKNETTLEDDKKEENKSLKHAKNNSINSTKNDESSTEKIKDKNINEDVSPPLLLKEDQNSVQTESQKVLDPNTENENTEILSEDRNTTVEKNDKIQNSFTTTTDSILPNNQEELNKNKSTKQASQHSQIEEISQKTNQLKNKLMRKRATSLENVECIERKKIFQKDSTKSRTVSQEDCNIQKEKKRKNVGSFSSKDHIINKTNKNDTKGNTDQASNSLNYLKDSDKISKKTSNTDDKSIKQNHVDEAPLKNLENGNESSQLSNPCLNSVSLYAEKFSSTKYTDSDETVNKNKAAGKKTEEKSKEDTIKNVNISNEVLILKSHSDSNSKDSESPPKNNKPVEQHRSERDKAIASIFGFSSGAVTTKRKRRISYRRTSNRRYSRRPSNISHNVSSVSSEWTSESDSDFVSPPRGRRNRHTRKYLKPKSARILSLQEEGGLFVMHGKKIFPLVKDGKIVKNYTTYLPESDTEEDGFYWKVKYEEEKRKTTELLKLLHSQKNCEEKEERSKSPVLQKQTSNIKTIPKNLQKQSIGNVNVPGTTSVIHDCEENNEESKQEKTVKIKFTKDNEEVQLEGHWPHIHPVLAQVVQIFHKDNKSKENSAKSETRLEASDNLDSVELSSGKSTPVLSMQVDKEVHEKVNKIEEEIFEEIQERDKVEQNNSVEQETERMPLGSDKKELSMSSTTSNPSVTSSITRKRIARSKKSDTITPSSSKKAKISNEKEKQEIAENDSKSQTEVGNDSANITFRKRTRTLKSLLAETVETNGSIAENTRRSKAKQMDNNKVVVEEDSQVRYRFPSPPPERKSNRKSAVNTIKNTKERKPNKRYSPEVKEILYSPGNLSAYSTESTLGYQDSDISPLKMCPRRKKKINLSHHYKSKFLQNDRTKSHPYITNDVSSESNNSIFSAPLKTIIVHNSSLNSEEYRSESYQLLNPVRNSFNKLGIIQETSPVQNELDEINTWNFTRISPRSKTDTNVSNGLLNQSNNTNNSNSAKKSTDIENSSHISLPLSPELSIVENLTINRNIEKVLRNNVDDYTINNEMQVDNMTQKDYDKYVMSEIDVSIPLMGQKCELKEIFHTVSTSSSDSLFITKVVKDSAARKTTEHNSKIEKNSTVTESLLNKICSVNIVESPPSPESLGQQLQNLLLESAKKMSETSSNIKINDNKDKENIEKKCTLQKKTQARKRSSTPRKKKTTLKSNPLNIETVIEEECMESFSCGGKKSCLPSIDVLKCATDNVNKEEINLTDKIVENSSKSKDRRKNIIKVKILKPINKNRQREKNRDNIQNDNNLSLFSDNGINETGPGTFCHILDGNLNLIHNHSETCLQANQCLDDSVEIIENCTRSIISLDSNSLKISTHKDNSQFQLEDEEDISTEMLRNNDQNCTSVCNVKPIETSNAENMSNRIFQTPLASETSLNSLITEDLTKSDETPKSNFSPWYLFSEDENSNRDIDLYKQNSLNTSTTSFGSDLNQLFPIVCAVPDLSTITEISRETDENSRKAANL